MASLLCVRSLHACMLHILCEYFPRSSSRCHVRAFRCCRNRRAPLSMGGEFRDITFIGQRCPTSRMRRLWLRVSSSPRSLPDNRFVSLLSKCTALCSMCCFSNEISAFVAERAVFLRILSNSRPGYCSGDCWWLNKKK